MKRYWLFAGDVYYPGGGMEDFVESYDLLGEALEAARHVILDEYKWAHVVDSQTGGVAYP